MVASDWDLSFEIMYDASDYALGTVLAQRKNKQFQPIYYASRTLNETQQNYTTIEKELLAVVFALKSFVLIFCFLKSLFILTMLLLSI